MVPDTASPEKRKSLSARCKLSLHLDFPKVVEGGCSSWSSDGHLPRDFTEKYGELGKILGSGAVARVREAARRSDGGKVAIKVIASQEDEMRLCAREEYEMMASLRHPHIVKVEGLHEGPSCLLIVMELCPAGSLDTHIHRQGVFQEPNAVHLFHHLLWGINYLHLKRIVHRDIKPQNLLLQNDPTQERGNHILRITDFNSAKRIGLSGRSDLMLSVRGTHFYSAPELRFGRIWNERVDIWASGLCFYYMRHAEAPLNILDPGHALLLGSGRLPEMSCTGFSNLARALLLLCLTVDMRDRPAAMELVLHPLFHAHNHDGRLRSRSCEDVGAHAARGPRIRMMQDLGCEATLPKARDGFIRQTTYPTTTRNWSNLVDVAGPEFQASHSIFLKESRNPSETLQRLANMRCERALSGQLEEEYSQYLGSEQDPTSFDTEGERGTASDRKPSLDTADDASPKCPADSLSASDLQETVEMNDLKQWESQPSSPTSDTPSDTSRAERREERRRLRQVGRGAIRYFSTHAAFDSREGTWPEQTSEVFVATDCECGSSK